MPIRVENGQPRTRQALLEIAQVAARDIRRRAFPTGGRAGRDLQEHEFKPLTPAYAKRKAKKGRPPVPDQRFTSGTANALGVTEAGATRAAIGWRERRVVADYLNRRNRYWGLTARETAAVDAIAQRAGADFARRFRISGTVVVGLGRR